MLLIINFESFFMLKLYRIIVYLLIITIPFFLLGCQGWLAPNVGAF